MKIQNPSISRIPFNMSFGPGLVLTLLLAAPAIATPPPTGVAPVTSPSGGIGIDGDLLARVPDASSGDWIAATNPAGTGEGVLAPDGTPLNPIRTFHFIDPYNSSSSDFIFTGGSKWGQNPNTWSWTTGKPSSKTDINNVLLHLATDSAGHTWVVIAADRASTSGDSYIDFEFLQSPLVRTNGGAFQSSGQHGGRTVNDMVLSLAFTEGGKVADFFAWRWVSDGSGGFVYADVTSALPPGRVFVALNTNTVAVPYSAFGQMAYAPNAFAEAAIDLTALLGGFDPCESFGFEAIMVKTKASASSSAGIEDFIDPIAYKLRIGPSANAGSDQTRCADPVATEFPLNGEATAGLTSVASIHWSVVSGTATIDDPSALNSIARVSSPSATLRLEAIQANGCSEIDDVVLTAVQPPALNIAGPGVLCPGSMAVFSGPPNMDTYQWSISGNGFLLGATNQQTVTVASGIPCGQPFELTLTAASNVCTVAVAAVVPVEDTVAPILTLPNDLVLECPADTRTNVTGAATASDDCGTVIPAYSDTVTNLCGGSMVISREWAATDSCGNTTRGTQTIVVRDTTPPVLSTPPNLVLEHPANTAPAATGIAIAQDACGTAGVTHQDSAILGCGGSTVITRTWTAVDECGNSASSIQTITVRDTTPPVLTLPGDVILECPANTDVTATGMATALDNSGVPTVTHSDSTVLGCGASRVITRTWSASDECGNVTTAIQTITVQDTTPPTLSAPPSVVLECPADTDVTATGVAAAQDNCGTPTVTHSDATVLGCGASRVITRTWSASDECGNVTTAIQTITIQDTTPPTLSAPPSVILECPADTDVTATGVATAQDNCGTPAVTHSDSTVFRCGSTKVITRTWSATDDCGNVATAIQMIRVRDTTAPILSAPPSVILECPADTDVGATGVATAQDNCGTPTVTHSDSTVFGCGSSKVITRTWSARDECGNVATAVQIIQVRDTVPPVIDCPPFATVECGGSTDPDQTGWATGQDLCGSVTISYTDDGLTLLCGGTKIIGRTWMAKDECGNASFCHQRITVRDTTPPTISIPPDVTLEYPANTSTNATGVATGSDTCGAVTMLFADKRTEGCGGTVTIERTWTAIDECGNSSNGRQTITVKDTTPPTITCPNLKVQCPDDVPLPYANLAAFLAGGGTASDNSTTPLTFSLLSDSGLVGACPGKVTRVYQVIDACGNQAQRAQIITVHDTIAPMLSCPGNVTVECGTPLDPTVLGSATATDNCSPDVVLNYSDATVGSSYNIKWYAADPDVGTGPYSPTYPKLAPVSLPCPDTAHLTGRAIDPLRNAVAFASPSAQLDALTSLGGAPMALGQVVPFEAVIEVGGGPGPERGTIEFVSSWSTHTTSNERFGYDTNYMVYCAFVDPADPGTLDPHFNARVESFSSTLVDRGTINEKIQGTFRISGLESGDRVVVEIWVVLMSTKPGQVGGTIASELVSAQKATTPPQPLSIGTQTVSIGNLSKISSTLPTVPPQPPAPPLPPQPAVLPGATVSVINRTWSATDDCGNRNTCVQQITVRDTTAPIMASLPPATVECGDPTDPDHTGWAQAQDGCGTASIQYTDSVTPLCGGSVRIDRTWKATDESGNISSLVQTITVADTTPPVFIPAPDLVVAGESDWNMPTPLATDACSEVSVILYSLVTNALPDGSQTIDCTWEAVDACGNASLMSHKVSVLPVIILEPRLTIGRSGGQLSLTWPAQPAGWWLESTSSLTKPAWQPVGITPTLINETCGVTTAPTGPCRWFRIATGKPPLTLTSLPGGKLMLSWPSLATGYLVERCDDLSSGIWTALPGAPLVTNGFNCVEFTPTGQPGFFRLTSSTP